MKQYYTATQLEALQREFETEMHQAGIERYHSINDSKQDQSETDWGHKLIKNLVKPMTDSVEAHVNYHMNKKGMRSEVIYILSVFKDLKVPCYIGMKALLSALPIKNKPVSKTSMSLRIGSLIEDQLNMSNFSADKGEANKQKKYLAKVKKRLAMNASKSYKHKAAAMVNATRTVGMEEISLSDHAKVKLGSFLLDNIAESVFIDGEPMAEIKAICTGRHSSLMIIPTQSFLEWIENHKELCEALQPVFGPLVSKPRPWVSPFEGGYLTQELADKMAMVKTHDKGHLKRLTRDTMPVVYDSINHLQNVAWSINEDMLDVLQEVSDMPDSALLPKKQRLELEPSPFKGREDLNELHGDKLKEAVTDKEWEDFIKWKRRVAVTHTDERIRIADRLSLATTLSAYEKYSEFEKLYFVYSLDFRGRVYCASSTITPQGQDYQKGMLRFAEGKALTEQGIKWFKIHGANVWGKDKARFSERIAYIDAMEDQAVAIASDPLGHMGLWGAADKPWQALNWTLEYADFILWQRAGNKPEEFVSHIPCAMDGSCSGIQHYSALLRDHIGGASVNLVNDEEPQDIYDDVSDVVVRKLHQIIAESDMPEEREMAKLWLQYNLVNRNLCKKPVMTLPYGSTRITCTDSVVDYLAGSKVKHPFIKDSENDLDFKSNTVFMSALIWDSIGEVVVAARAGMKFIREVSKAVSKENMPLEWVTPTGFIIKQSIYKQDIARVKTELLGTTKLTLRYDSEDIDTRKMGTSTPPNYIHGNDASHLTLTVDECRMRGINSIAVIHDDFGTHACDTEELHLTLRGCLVEMYEEDRLAEFKRVQENRIGKKIKVEVPEFGNLDLKGIYESTYIFA